tara:strand:+ start:1894 stop:2169 length:276 start_codon:yes stop_codon:yes gene_type:complete
MFIYTKEQLDNIIEKVSDSDLPFHNRVQVFQKISALQAWRININQAIQEHSHDADDSDDGEYCAGCESGADSIEAHTKSCNIRNGFVPRTF